MKIKGILTLSFLSAGLILAASTFAASNAPQNSVTSGNTNNAPANFVVHNMANNASIACVSATACSSTRVPSGQTDKFPWNFVRQVCNNPTASANVCVANIFVCLGTGNSQETTPDCPGKIKAGQIALNLNNGKIKVTALYHGYNIQPNPSVPGDVTLR